MHREIDTKNAAAVKKEVERVYRSLFSSAKADFVEEAFGLVTRCFSGEYADYQPIDVRYHDLEHTLQGTLCLVRLMEGYIKADAEPALNQRMFELALLAILLHDTGYLKKRGDNEGTGAKYTLTHVTRSADFAGKVLGERGYSAEEIHCVQNMIQCTGLNANLKKIPFSSELERKMGYALATADLLGQMAAPDYIEKLGILYDEFAEAARFNGTAGPFASLEDLRKKTPGFWAHYVLPKVNNDFLSLHRFLSYPPTDQNYYILRIEENIQRLKRQMDLEQVAG